MLKNLKKIRKDKFIWSSLILTAAFFFYNAANFFYHFFAARQLGPEDYAAVAALFSIVYLFSVSSNVIQTSITKFVATFYAKKEFGKIKFLKKRALRKLFIYSVIVFIAYSILSPFIASFLHIGIIPVLLTGTLLLFTFIIPVNRGILQGIQKFGSLGLNWILEGGLKLGLAIVFIYMGFRVNGAIGALVIGVIIAFLFSFTKIDKKPKKFDTKGIYSYSYAVLLAILSITALFSLDVIIVKNIFIGEEAGFYSALSLLGKIVFFGATAISFAMFSKVSELHAKKGDHKSVFKKAMVLTGLISFGITAIYFIFPKLIFSIIFGEAYLGVAHLLGPFGIFMAFTSLTYIIVLYKLSLDLKRFIYLLLVFNIIQIVGIYFFSQSIAGIIYFLVIFSILLFVSLLAISNKSK